MRDDLIARFRNHFRLSKETGLFPMLAHAGRWALLAGAVLSVTALSIADTFSSPLDSVALNDSALATPQVEVAQGYGRPPGDLAGDSAYGAPRSDEAGLVLRIDRLENQIRQLTGQIEQMQFNTRRLEEQLKKFHEDVEFRFQENAGHGGPPPPPPAKPLQRRSEAEPVDVGGDDPISGIDSPAEIGPSKKPFRRGDAFDPVSDPAAPGAPRPLGSLASTEPSVPAGRPQRGTGRLPGLDGVDPDSPLDLSGGKLRGGKDLSAIATRDPPSETPTRPMPPVATRPPGPSPADTGSAPSRPSADPVREEFDLALGLLKQKEYENAEKSFTTFLQKNPKSKLASDATYYLGETYFQRGRQREAAEQYLRISTSYAGSQRAPEAFLRLGQSLNALGAKEQACAAYAEIERKYPNASASVKSGVERETKRARC
jgi:tol-pal system protein YbgF